MIPQLLILQLSLTRVALGQRGLWVVITMSLAWCAVQPEFWRMLRGLYEYRD